MTQIPDSAVQAELDTRLKAAGMYTVEEVMAGTPVDKWRVHSGMNNLQFFGEWLERKAREYKVMAAGYDLGDKDKSDELYEWALAHSGAFHDVLVNFRAATVTNEGSKPVDVADVRRQAFEEGFENGVEQSLDALNAYDDITRNEAEQDIIKLKPDYRALSAEPTQGEQWLPIETAPKDWSDVLLFDPTLNVDHRNVCEGYYDTEFNEWHSPACGVISPTHWMPLPSAPTPEEEA